MIQLKSNSRICDDFRVNASEYASRPSLMQQANIRLLEQDIINRSIEFLSNPDEYVSQWEELTGEEMPSQYTEEFPSEIHRLVCQASRKTVTGYRLRLLPTVEKSGASIVYPEDRLVADFAKDNQTVYILKDSILKELATAA